MVSATPSTWRRRDYLMYPEKFLDETWRALEQRGLASWDSATYDYGVPVALGLLMMSLLADACAGTQVQKITDRVQAYSWLAEQQATALGAQYVKGLDISQVAPALDRLVSISLDVLDARRIPMQKLVDFRNRESRAGGEDFVAMRRKYS